MSGLIKGAVNVVQSILGTKPPAPLPVPTPAPTPVMPTTDTAAVQAAAQAATAAQMQRQGRMSTILSGTSSTDQSSGTKLGS